MQPTATSTTRSACSTTSPPGTPSPTWRACRKALGQRRINYYGFSYGTYLGQVYATLHPDRVRRFVLDSNVDPRRVWYQANLDQDHAFDRTSRSTSPGWPSTTTCSTWAPTRTRSIDATTGSSTSCDAHPTSGRSDRTRSTDVFLIGRLRRLRLGRHRHGLRRAGCNHGDASGIKDLYLSGNPQHAPGSDNGFAIYLATPVHRRPVAAELEHAGARDNWRTYASAPFLTWANAWFNGPCTSGGATSGRHAVHTTGKHVTSEILLIDETLDAATPFSGSLEVRRRFPTASLIADVGGTTHAGSLSGVACTDDTIARYLADGSVPPRTAGNGSDKKCPPVPAPDPNAPAGRGRLAGTPAAEIVRQVLQQAQLH